MSAPRIYSADEARALREAATPGPYTTNLGADLYIAVDDGTEEGGETPVVIATIDVELAPTVQEMDNGLLLAAAPDLAASVEHHAARAAAAEKRVAELLADRAEAVEVLVTEVERAQVAERRVVELRAQLDAAHAHIATLERVAFTACGHADDLGEKLSELEAQIAARDAADARSLRVETTLDPLYILRAVEEVEPGYVDPSTRQFLEAIAAAARARLGGSR